MNRTVASFLLSVVTVGAVGAPPPPMGANTYGQALVTRFAKAEPGVLALTIAVIPPKSSDTVVVASTDKTLIGEKPAPPTTAVAMVNRTSSELNQASGQVEVRLPLRDVSSDNIGMLSVRYASRPGTDRATLERDAEHIRDQLHRRITHVGNLLDAWPYEPDAPTATYAQTLTDEFLDKYPDIEIFAIHATPPDSDYNIIVGSNIGRIGKKADNDDMRCVFTGKPNLEINSTGKRMENELQLHDRSGRVIGAVSIVYAYAKGADKEALHARAEAVRAALEQRIPDSASLFKSVQ